MPQILVKRGLQATWFSLNPILSSGEFGYETDSRRLKIGNGTDDWNNLPYIPLTALDLGLGEVDNTSDADKAISDATQTALDGKEPSLSPGTTGQYYRGDKSWQTLDKTSVGLPDVDNTADVDKPISDATQTALDGKAESVHVHSQSEITDLTVDLATIGTTAQTALATAQLAEVASNKGQAGGYASLDGGGKVPATQLPNSIMEYQGTWDASTNTPTLADGVGDAGNVYRVGVAGTQDLGSGAVSFLVSDYAIYNGSTWEKADTTDAVASVNGYTGVVDLTTSDVVEGMNLYYTPTRADDRVTAAVGVSVQAYSATLDSWSGKTVPTGSVVGTSDSQTLTSKTLTNPTINSYIEGVVAIGTVTSSFTIDLTNGTVQTATLTASTACTFTMPTATAGKSFTLLLKQASSTGNGSATFTGVKWGTLGAPTITATAGKMDILTFFADGTNWYGSAAQGYTP